MSDKSCSLRRLDKAPPTRSGEAPYFDTPVGVSVSWKDYTQDGSGITTHQQDLSVQIDPIPSPGSLIAAQALQWIGQSDKSFAALAGVDCENACVITVNYIVHAATGKFLGGEADVNNVDPLRSDGDVTPIQQSDAVPGDFLIVDSKDGINGHIGICLNRGCTNVISNSSTYCTFTFESDNNARFSYAGSPYRGGTPTYWRAVLK